MEQQLKELAVLLFEIDAIKFGDFVTKIGLKTPVYIDLRTIISHPKIFNRLSSILWSLHDDSENVDQICGVPYTALPIASLISVESNIPMVIRRKEAKSYGTKKLIEGKFKAGDTCIIIEDVVTSGSSILEVVKDLIGEGLSITGALVIMDREQGGRQNIENNGIKMKSLYTLTQLMQYLLAAGKISTDTVQNVKDYLTIYAAPIEILNNELTNDRLKMDFASRSKLAKNPLASKLLQIMDMKETMLCLAADLIKTNSILELAKVAGPYIAVLKIHVDIIEDFNQDFIKHLKHLSLEHRFLIMEDRKFADIGNTVSHQYSNGLYKIAEWADLITVHPVAGPGIFNGVKNALKHISDDRGIFVITEMSSEGSLTTGKYVKDSLKLSETSDLVVGHVCQSNIFSDPGLIQLTPGVKLAKASDDLGQQYNTPESVVNAGADLAVVGRGIIEASDKMAAILQYKKQLWYSFPFGRPEGALKATLSLLERVLMKDISTPVPADEVRGMIKSCLETAALVNYDRLSAAAKIEDDYNGEVCIPPGKKLDDLIRLAELCVDLLQQNEEHYSEAFAWFSDLLVEHAEIFWSLFAVDMDKVLSEQPPDTWDSFPLFQILNDYLRMDDNLKNGRFHQHLRDTFAPLVVRYVDLMETSIAQSIHKGFEKERWEIKGNGCATSEDSFWKLDALQSFIGGLHWPDQEFRQHLEQRLKLMACDMIESCIQRTDTAFQQWLKKGVTFISTDYIIPSEMCAMVNVILDAKNQSFKLCTVDSVDVHQYHEKIDDLIDKTSASMNQGMINKLVTVLEATLSKLSRYDEGSFIGSILSFTKVSGSGKEMGQAYVNFTRNCMDQIRSKVIDELWILNFFEQWYIAQIQMLCNWLSDRLDHNLHLYQCTCLAHIVKKIYSDFELQGVMEDKLNSKTYQTISQRMQTEEATCALTMSAQNDEGLSENGNDDEVERPKTKVTIVESTGADDANYVANISNVTSNVVGKVGSMFGKGIGGLSTKFGGPSWF